MPKDIPHSLPYPGVSSLAAAGQSYMNHPQHYQKLGTDENYDQEANEEFEQVVGENIEGWDIIGASQIKFNIKI